MTAPGVDFATCSYICTHTMPRSPSRADSLNLRNADRLNRIVLQRIDEYIASLEYQLDEWARAYIATPNHMIAGHIKEYETRIRVMQEFRCQQKLNTAHHIPREHRASPPTNANAVS